MKKFLPFLALLIFCVSIDVPLAGVAKENPLPDSAPYQSVLLMEVETGQIPFSYEIHRQWPPASLCKMMLMLIVKEKVQEGSLSLTDEVVVSVRARRMGGSQVYLSEGEIFTLEELMKAVAIKSANDAAVAVAEYVAGTVEVFVDSMNRRAKELDMADTVYHSVHGLPPAPGQKEDLTSAYDQAILARKLVAYPQILRWSSIVKEEFREGKFILNNTNKLVGLFRGLDGLKTGYYQAAGYNIVATASREEIRFIAVVLGASTSHVRFSEAARLLGLGFDRYRKVTAIKKGSPLNEGIRVVEGKKGTIIPVASRDAVILVHRGEEGKIEQEPHLVSIVQAPVSKGERVGKIRFIVDGKLKAEVPAIVPEEVPQASFFWRFLWKFSSAMKGLVTYLLGWVKDF